MTGQTLVVELAVDQLDGDVVDGDEAMRWADAADEVDLVEEMREIDVARVARYPGAERRDSAEDPGRGESRCAAERLTLWTRSIRLPQALRVGPSGDRRRLALERLPEPT